MAPILRSKLAHDHMRVDPLLIRVRRFPIEGTNILVKTSSWLHEGQSSFDPCKVLSILVHRPH